MFLYEELYAALESSSITFSMYDLETKSYKITKKHGGVILKNSSEDCINKKEYCIYYNFSEKDTNKIGRYVGEFKIDFYDSVPTNVTATFIAPITNDLHINIVKPLFTELNRENNGGIFNDVFTMEYN